MKSFSILLTLLVPTLALAQAPAAKQPAPAPAAQPAPAAKAPAAAPAAKPPAAAPAVKAPPPPPPPPEVKATVDAFKGNWRFDVTMTGTGMPGMDKPVNAKMSFNCKTIAGGNAVSCDSKAKTPMGPMDATFIVAYDPYGKNVHFIGITNMFEVHDHICQWTKPTELACTPLKAGMGPMGDEITEELSMTVEKNTATFKSTSRMTKGGGTMVFEGKGKK